MDFAEKNIVKANQNHTDKVFIIKDIEKNIENIKEQILDINYAAYLVNMSSQKENMNSRSMAMRTIMLILSGLSFLIGSLL